MNRPIKVATIFFGALIVVLTLIIAAMKLHPHYIVVRAIPAVIMVGMGFVLIGWGLYSEIKDMFDNR